ncbi:adenosylcobinamide amidohydrolase [Eubacterium sp. 1001713B170207_170306_E7]|uniref:adenosylcobinamide amidohydrolase n=1 Tax=Eubacterium sp. 1001713B170207_170306_E7 TaxID=2787097 RepID=UPI001896D6CC|nr:adenosylcobinamide amidohydrolase [Eubacterium sp. 1001713B170207_170306_E7]
MKEYKLATGDTARLDYRAAVIRFEDERRVLSSSLLNGGLRSDLRFVFNYDEQEEKTKRCEMLAPTHEEHLRIVAEDILGLPPRQSTGLTTAAQIRNAAFCEAAYGETAVSALVTAGVSGNALRAGDRATLDQKDGRPFVLGGTINVILAVDANLPDGTMLQAFMTCTEAKTAALERLGCKSVISDNGATGTGTDGVVIIARPGAPLRMTDAGKHFKLGELIGQAVELAVRKALYLQEGLTS